MEGVGHFSSVQDLGPEALQEPVNLLQTYGENVVTLFGITAPLDQLAKMCPIDLTDPSKLDAVNTFVAKAANEAGMEIKPEHEAVFANVIEKTGAERKFVVAESKNTSPEPKVEKARVEQPDKLPAVRPEDIKTVKSLDNKEREISIREAVSIVPASIIAAIKARQIQEFIEQNQGNAVKATKAVRPVKIENVIKESVDNKLTQIDPITVQEPVLAEAKQDNIVPVEYRTEPSAESVIDDFFTAQEIPVNEIAQIKDMDEFVQEDFDIIFDQIIESLEYPIDAPAETVEIIETVSPSANYWGELLFESPDEMFNDFVFELENFAAQITPFDNLHPNVSVDNNDLESEANSPKIENIIAPIFQLVAEKLTLLDDKTEATEQLQSIIGAIHGIRILEGRGADTTQIDLVREQLLELSAELFQQLGIEYNEKMVKLFVWTLLRPEFVLLNSRDKSYKQLGTHESKQEPSQYFDPSQTDRNPGHYVLGGLAVLYTTVLGDLRNLQLV